MDTNGFIMYTTYIHSSSSMDTHGYIMDTIYTAAAWIHMDTHGYIMYTIYTAATTAWIHIATSWILHTQQQQQHGYTRIHHGYNKHSSSSTDTHGYIMYTTYTAAAPARIHMDTPWILHTHQQQQQRYT
jgi:hypothetical protein